LSILILGRPLLVWLLMNENSFDSGSYEVVYCCHPSMQILLTDVHLLFNKTVIATPIRENHECKCKDM